ncbi:MAG: tetratricopeptide repeat protein [Nitrospiria bacterium]
MNLDIGYSNSNIHPQKKTKILFSTLLSAVLFLNSTLTAQASSLQEADKLARSGHHAEAETVYDTLLQDNPNDLKARLGRAHVRAWRGRQKSAQSDFLAALKADPRNTDALVGLGYSYAWSGDHDRAETRFQEALQVDPSRGDAKKGAAYNALWGEKIQEAIHRFQTITRDNPEDTEALVGLGRAFLEADRTAEAKKAFEETLRIAPGNKDARQGLEALRHSPPHLDLSLWLGHTSHGGGTGLRTLEISGLIKRDLRLWARYDNALSLDNPALVREGRKIPSYFIGALINWGKIYTTRLEIGTRELRDEIDQDLFQGEHVVYLPEGYSLKFGGLLGPKENDGTDWNVYTGIGIPLKPHLSLYPTFYYTKTGGIDETEWRILLPVEYRFREGWRAGVYPLLGHVSSVIPNASGTVWGFSSVLSAPLRKDHEGHLLIRYEEPVSSRAFTIVALGITLKLGRD